MYIDYLKNNYSDKTNQEKDSISKGINNIWGDWFKNESRTI